MQGYETLLYAACKGNLSDMEKARTLSAEGLFNFLESYQLSNGS